MKIKLFVILQLITLGAFAQKGFKLYAYQQEISGGASKMVADPNGNIVSANQKQVNYLFYMELTGDSVPEISEVWINGVLYEGKLKEANSPVTIHQKMSIEKDPVPDTLVRSTNNKVYQLIPLSSQNPDRKTNKASKANEVCIFYTLNSKKYKIAKPIKSLERIVNQ
jgi:hypothetical protein